MFLLAMLACSELPVVATGDTGTVVTSGVGKLALTFRLDSDYMAVMDEDPVGTFYGSLWRGSEVSGIGPEAGAVDLGGIRVDLDLLPEGGPTAVLFTSEDLPVEPVVVLGFLDSDDNADPGSPGPDPNAPVTQPGQNEFLVAGDTVTEVEVFFGLLNP